MTDRPDKFFQGTEMPTAGWWEALWSHPAGVLVAVGLRSGMTVIDLCSGDGWFTLQIAKVARHVSAIDIDPNLLEIARHRLVESGVTNCDFIAGDAYDIAKLAGPADFVFMANAFHGVPDRSRLAQAVASALKADGYFAIVNWHKRSREETPIGHRIENVTGGNNRVSGRARIEIYKDCRSTALSLWRCVSACQHMSLNNAAIARQQKSCG
jgi:ubiquinone/menaquinone biosynthesis C-methylase UbiE